MKSLEERLRDIVKADTVRAAVDEWITAQHSSETPLYDYRFDHVTEVVRIAKHLASEAGARADIVAAAAWLHDIAKPGMGGTKSHAKRGAEIARDILVSEGMASEDVEMVCEVIASHEGLTLDRPLKLIEAQVLWEADKIVKLGAVGVIHYVVNGIKLHPGSDLSMMSEDMAQFMPLAARIAESMSTPAGKRLAMERLAVLRGFVESLSRELSLEETHR